MRTGIVIGMGETGKPLFEILKEAYPDMLGMDIFPIVDVGKVQFMHICIPYNDIFITAVKRYQKMFTPEVTIIHSTVPIGTTAQIPNAVHSPIQGRHDRMKSDLLNYPKWIGGEQINKNGSHDVEDWKNNGLSSHLTEAGFKTRWMDAPEQTEAMKLLCLAHYGVELAMAHYEYNVIDKYRIDHSHFRLWNEDYNGGVGRLARPIFGALTDKIGGHCVTQNTRLLNDQHPNPMLDEVLKYAEDVIETPKKPVATHEPSNIYPTAQFGESVRVGAFSEIGHNVKIGHYVTIGAFAFIPEGVTIEDGAWIGPRVTFSNDMYPPSGRDKWENTLVGKGARIGAGVCVLPGVTIGAGALIGMGAVVTQDIPSGETWAGVPARKVEKSNGDNYQSQTSAHRYSYM